MTSNGSELSRRLSTLDAGFLYFERPTQLLHIASILTVEGRLDYERLIADIEARLHMLPRYMERVVPAPFGLAHPTWERDPQFDLRAHVHHRTLRSPGGNEQLAELCETLYTQPLDRTKPLWELYLIDGYRGQGGAREAFSKGTRPERYADDSPPRSALFAKVHHCMIDGVSGVQLMGILLDVSPKPSPPPPAPDSVPCPPLPGLITGLIDAVSSRVACRVREGIAALGLLGRPRRVVEQLRETADAITHALRTIVTGSPQTPLNGTIGIGRSLAWVTFSLNETKALKNRLGGSVNDVVLAVISGALRRTLAERGMNPDRVELRAVVPVNLRGTAEHLKLGNQISIMVAPLPVGIHDPLERLRQVRAAIALLKSGKESAKIERIVQLLELVPPPLQQLFGWVRGLSTPVNTICTNVPGPPIALYMQGLRMNRMMPFVPLAEGMGVAFAILSYADTLTIGITADTGLVPDVRDVVVPLRESFEELWALTGLERVERERPVRPERQRRRTAGAVHGGTVEMPATAVDQVVPH